MLENNIRKEIMKRDLFICNSVYQVLVALWIKYNYCHENPSDILISDHMNNGEQICEKVVKYSEFDKGFYVKSYAFSRYKIKQNRLKNIKQNLTPFAYLKEMVSLEAKYSDIYAANVDNFTSLVYDALARKNTDLKMFIFEDGMYTYSKLMRDDYVNLQYSESDSFRKVLYKYIYNKKYIYGRVAGIYLFHPEDLVWDVDFEIISMQKIDCSDKIFLDMCNKIFGYYESRDRYERKYIFMEESFAAEGMPINDLELLEKLAQRVGKDNIMVKIHPRNPINRFAEKGYLTNENTSIPWEIIAMNLDDISDKVFITVASSSILNPILIFGKKIRAFSLYNLVDEQVYQSKLLSGDFWDIIYNTFNKYNDMITICNSINEIN